MKGATGELKQVKRNGKMKMDGDSGVVARRTGLRGDVISSRK